MCINQFSFSFILFLIVHGFSAVFISFTWAAKSIHHEIPIGLSQPEQSPLTGIGTVEKIFSNDKAGWFELFIHAAPWPTDVLLDGQTVGHISFANNVFGDNSNNKAMNLFVQPGVHRLRLERLYHPGLPYIHSIELKPSSNLSGKVSIEPVTDRMVFRAREDLTVRLLAEKLPSNYKVDFIIRDAFNDKVIDVVALVIPSGSGNYIKTIKIPTNKEGVFNVEVKHVYYGRLARSFQYVVVNTSEKADLLDTSGKELIKKIDPTQTKPDYASKNLSINSIDSVIGPYLESFGDGVYGHQHAPDYFAYELDLPDNSGFYLAEIDYPDNAHRAFTISLVEKSVNPYALDAGVTTGGNYQLSQKKQTSHIYFYAREHDPRLLFLNWHQGKKIAVSEIRVYRLNGNSLPPLFKPNVSTRKFSSFYEEPMRFTSYFGAKPSGNSWVEIFKTAERWAKWSNSVGQNHWLQSIANYQHVMWPTNLLPGYAPSDEDAFSLLGPVSPYDLHKKDVLQLLLLMAEKYDIELTGELAIPASGYIKKALDKRFNATSLLHADSKYKPWLIVSSDGKVGGESVFKPYFNPAHPYVQQWVEEIVSELAFRYRGMASFDGVAIRLMGWAFASWQAFPSIHWGYGDFTIKRFVRETGIEIPISKDDPDRFNKRYEWLTNNHYDDWVNWRTSVITAFHKKLYDVLKEARSDLKLYINVFGTDFAQSDWGQYGGWQGRYKKLEKLGWTKMLRETGVDPMQYENELGMIFSNSYKYPAGIRSQFNVKGAKSEDYEVLQWQEANESSAIQLSKKSDARGSVSSARFDNEYMEYDFPVNLIGYDKLQWRDKKKLRIAANVTPSGRGVLRRYAWAMYEGNITSLTDGGLGYIQGNPKFLREFMLEYHSLPNITMKRSVLSDNVALWGGKQNNLYYLYLVNKGNKKVTSTVCFSSDLEVARITSDEVYKTDVNNRLHLSVEPYGLIAFKSKFSTLDSISCND